MIIPTKILLMISALERMILMIMKITKNITEVIS